jgi:hypothetical protein
MRGVVSVRQVGDLQRGSCIRHCAADPASGAGQELPCALLGAMREATQAEAEAWSGWLDASLGHLRSAELLRTLRPTTWINSSSQA